MAKGQIPRESNPYDLENRGAEPAVRDVCHFPTLWDSVVERYAAYRKHCRSKELNQLSGC